MRGQAVCSSTGGTQSLGDESQAWPVVSVWPWAFHPTPGPLFSHL